MTPSTTGTLLFVKEFGMDHDSCESVTELACAAAKNSDKVCMMPLESIVGARD
jgi:hypothetical protein